MSSVKNIFEETIKTDHKVITEEAAKSILKKYGIKVPGFALVKSTDEAVKAAKKMNYRFAIFKQIGYEMPELVKWVFPKKR